RNRERARPSKIFAKIETTTRGQKRLPEVAELFDTTGNILYREIFDAYAVVNFFPRHWRRDGCLRPRANGVNRGERPAPGVLVVVHEDATMRPLGHLVLRGDQSGMAMRELLRQRLGERPDFLLKGTSHDWNVDVKPFRSGGL